MAAVINFETLVVREAHIVLVDWIDSQQDGGGWRTFNSNEVVENKMQSIGYLVEADKDKVAIVPHVGMDSRGLPSQMQGRIIIPQEQIKRIVRLVEAERQR
jgi:hypothetical protein